MKIEVGKRYVEPEFPDVAGFHGMAVNAAPGAVNVLGEGKFGPTEPEEADAPAPEPMIEILLRQTAALESMAASLVKLANPLTAIPTNEELRDMIANSPRMTEKQIRSVRFKFPEEPGARHVVGSVQIRPVFQPGSYGMPDNLDKVAHRDIEKTTGIDNFLTATEVLAAQEAARKSPRTLGLDAYGPDVITPLTSVDVDRAHCEAGIHDGCDCLKPKKKESPELPWMVNWSPEAGQDPYAQSVVTYHFGDDYCPQFPGHYVKHEPGSGRATIRPISDIYADLARYVVTE